MILRLHIDAFPLDPELTRVLDGLRQDPRLSRSSITVRPGGLGSAIEHYQSNATPQLLIVEDEGDATLLETRLALLAEVCVAGTQLLVVGKMNDIATYRRLISLGVGDYLVGPVTQSQLADSIATLFADPTAAPAGRMIAFIGASGGAGSSAMAHNTAWLLSQAGEEVIAADLDLAFGSMGLAFNVEARQTIGELLGEPGRVDSQMIERVLVTADDKLQLLPSPGLTQIWPQIEIDEIDRVLELLRRMAPTVVLDLPHAWAPWVGHTLELADEVVITATPDLLGLRDAKGLLDALSGKRASAEPARLVLNKVDQFKKTQLLAKDFDEALKLSPALSIPFDPAFPEALNEGQMAAKICRNHKVTDPLQALMRLVGPRGLRPAAPAAKPGRLDLDWLKQLSPLILKKG